jgi:uncharacterized protein (DUF58 family)
VGEAFQGRLLNGERVVWKGRPAGGLLLTARDTFLIPFSLLWCGFAVFWEFSAVSQRNGPGFFLLFGLFFVLVGLYSSSADFLWTPGRAATRSMPSPISAF